jgi:glycosyltransferase involved in cell wall biosynthesis
MPRLLLVSSNVAQVGGVESYLEDLLFGLAPLGWDLHILTAHPLGETNPVVEKTHLQNVIVIDTSWLDRIDYAAATRTEISKLRPDIVMTYAYESPIMIVPNEFDCPVKIVEVVHNPLPWEGERIVRWHQYLDGVVAISQETFEFVDQLLYYLIRPRPLPLRLIRHGIRMPDFPARGLRPGSEPLRMIWFGRIVHDQKRVLDLIPICEGLERLNLQYQLTLLGSGSELPSLKEALGTTCRTGQVVFIPAVQRQEVFPLLFQQDIFLCTSDVEGGPLTLIESMACGVVPIATRIGGYSAEVIVDGRTGFHVDVADAPGFVDKIAYLDDRRALLRDLSRSCREFVATKFANARMARNTDSFLRLVLEEPARRPAPTLRPVPR